MNELSLPSNGVSPSELGVGHTRIKSITFSMWGAEDIIKHSACKVDCKMLYGPGSVSDPKMGRLENNEICPTCFKTSKLCPGHWGYIKLSVKIIHPLYISPIIHILKVFCWSCSSALISKERFELLGLLNKKRELRLKSVLAITSKIHECPMCGADQPLFNENKTEKIITKYPSKKITKIKQKKLGIVISGEDISEVFENIAEEDIELIGLDTHPRNLIITVLPVLPPRARPHIMDQGKISEDDLTHKYPEIVKMDQRVASETDPEERKKAIANLEFHIKTLFDNSQGKAKLTKDRPMKSLKQRLTGKEGLFRGNLMGKRVDESWRTVIGPDPTLRVDEVVVPPQICKNLKFPERVFEHNRESLLAQIYEGTVSTIIKPNGVKLDAKVLSWSPGTRLEYGDRIKRGTETLRPESTITFVLEEGDIILREGEDGIISEIPAKLPERKPFNLDIGDKVFRQLREGDWVLINRQPSLHKGSIMGCKVVIREGKNMRMPLGVCNSYNSDFDGDEIDLGFEQVAAA
jgi:DNA-directed RNA polymerase beta' subunit